MTFLFEGNNKFQAIIMLIGIIIWLTYFLSTLYSSVCGKGLAERKLYENLEDSIVLKIKNNITIIQLLMLKDIKEFKEIFNKKTAYRSSIDINSLKKKINHIVTYRDNYRYKYTDYKNCKLIKETKDYYECIAENKWVSSSFIIYKIYFGIK